MEDKKEVFVCSFENCLKTFTKRNRLVIHIRTHTGERPYACSIFGCDKRYSRPAHLTRHVETTHAHPDTATEDKESRFRCIEENCDAEFLSKHSLKRHINRIHTRESFKCKMKSCGEVFKKHHQLAEHIAKHTLQNPYRCEAEDCDKSFPTPSKLKRHMKMHEGYQCDQDGCTAKFNKWTLLCKHKTVDHVQDHLCNVCGKRFSQKQWLRQHHKIHSVTRDQIVCPRENCGRAYLDQRNLTAHIRSYHDGQKVPCTMEGCEKKFATKQKLLQHQKLHDPNRPPPPKKKVKKRNMKKKSIVEILTGVKCSEVTLVDADKELHAPIDLGHEDDLKCFSHDLTDNSVSISADKPVNSVTGTHANQVAVSQGKGQVTATTDYLGQGEGHGNTKDQVQSLQSEVHYSQHLCENHVMVDKNRFQDVPNKIEGECHHDVFNKIEGECQGQLQDMAISSECNRYQNGHQVNLRWQSDSEVNVSEEEKS
ncbi:hypothetical protein CHS0354_006639 [Potamilus streckersoni]|uniref:C2H2-type domain-containing protein n=1 Tax=Potamilus streckersoni TaxID=2493646 RepID=A0AAE0SWG5_9BIVA|nr:hypothetical protein CHS0354_006639 [Potamilus streckersoni]